MSAELPPRGARALRRAAQWLRAGDLGAASKAIAEAHALAPDHPGVARAQAVLRQRRAPPASSLDALARAVAERPDDGALRIAHARALRDAGRLRDALVALREACRVAPDDAGAWFNLGTLLFVGGEIDEALDAFARAHALAPRHVGVLLAYAETLKMHGDIDAAASHIRSALAVAPATAHAWHALVNLKTVPLTDAEMQTLERIYTRGALSDADRAVAGFALAASLERAQRYEEAYHAFVEANTLKRREIEWSPAWFSAIVDRSISAFDTPPQGVRDPDFGREAIFVVSLPRSGSTLTEQILASHHDVAGGDELRDLPLVIEQESRLRGADYPAWVGDATEDDWRRLGQTYLDRVAKRRGERARCTDKGLANWQFIGAIRAMLPGARIVHCRRDAVETCWSCFTQLFPIGQIFSYELGEMAAFWHDYARLMRFWETQYPGAVHDVVYERLVEAPETEIGALLDACGLPFDPACLNFHENERQVRTPSAAQVREPLRRDTARTAQYGTLLDPLRKALGTAP